MDELYYNHEFIALSFSSCPGSLAHIVLGPLQPGVPSLGFSSPFRNAVWTLGLARKYLLYMLSNPHKFPMGYMLPFYKTKQKKPSRKGVQPAQKHTVSEGVGQVFQTSVAI